MVQEFTNKNTQEVITLLQQLIQTPSFSGEEDQTAQLIQTFFNNKNIPTQRIGNNIIVRNKFFNPTLPSLLLNSHHDTVKPNKAYTRNPFDAAIENGILYGLGSNDAGGPLVALAATFLEFYEQDNLPLNIIYAATAEEENSGPNGVEMILKELGEIQLAIVGEPTKMEMAVAERGLLVIDCTAKGKAGHAARKEGINAIYLAMQDIQWFQNYQFDKQSEWFGPVSMNVTIINAGSAHNQVPEFCHFTVDIRLNDCYTHNEVLDIIQQHVKSDIKPRSTRLSPSSISRQHPFVKLAVEQNIPIYGSPTTSDMALMNFPSVKMGPGDSARSHAANEFIYLNEIEEAVKIYKTLISKYLNI